MGGNMSQCYIRSRMHGKVLDVEGGQAVNEARVILWPQKPGNAPNQLWRFEPAAQGYSFVVSSLNPNMVMDVMGGSHPGAKIILYEKKFPPAPNQMFMKRGDTLVSAVNPSLVLDIEGGSYDDGAGVCLWNPKGMGDRQNQSWETNSVGASSNTVTVTTHHHSHSSYPGSGYPPTNPGYPQQPHYPQQPNYPRQPGFPQPPPVPQPPPFPQPPSFPQPTFPSQPGFGPTPGFGNCFIECRMNGKVLDVEGGQAHNGAKVIMWTKKFPPAINQQWRFEPAGNGWSFIVSALNPNMVLDVKGNDSSAGAKLGLWEKKFPPAENQMFQHQGDVIRSALNTSLVIDVKGNKMEDGAKIVLWNEKPMNDRWNQSFSLTPC